MDIEESVMLALIPTLAVVVHALIGALRHRESQKELKYQTGQLDKLTNGTTTDLLGQMARLLEESARDRASLHNGLTQINDRITALHAPDKHEGLRCEDRIRDVLAEAFSKLPCVMDQQSDDCPEK